MTIETTLNDTTATIVVSGKLTVATSPELEAEVQRLQGSATSFDIDLANLEYVSSAGLRVLVGAQKLASRAGGELRLLHPSKDVRDIFEMTGLAEIMTIVD